MSFRIQANISAANYLIPEPNVSDAIPIVLLILYFLLLFCMVATYGRLAYIIITDPGYVLLGSNALQNQSQKSYKRRDRHSEEYGRDYDSELDETTIGDSNPDSPGLENFYSKKVFVCAPDGRPKWCHECQCWKPDRTHHCSDVGRCVQKMDHYCPWVGGVVGENSFKFFIQFVFYAALYCVFNVVVMAVYLARKLEGTLELEVHFIVLLALSGFFGLFTIGMFGSSLQFALYNLTTIENLSNKRRPWTLAVLIPESFQIPKEGHYPHITYPLPLTKPTSSSSPSTQQTETPEQLQIQPQGTHSNDPTHLAAVREARDARATRTFAILTLGVGRNPWDLGWRRNFTSVMGHSAAEWLLPIKRSPLCRHEVEESWFEYGRWVEQLMVDVGFMDPSDISKPKPVSVPFEERHNHIKALTGKHEKARRKEEQGFDGAGDGSRDGINEGNGSGERGEGWADGAAVEMEMSERISPSPIAITAEGVPRRAH